MRPTRWIWVSRPGRDGYDYYCISFHLLILAENPPVKKALRKRRRMDEKEAKQLAAAKAATTPTVTLDLSGAKDSVKNRPDSSSDDDDSPSAKFRRGEVESVKFRCQTIIVFFKYSCRR